MHIIGNKVGGRIKINGRDVTDDPPTLQCSCGNSTNWSSMTINNNSATAVCGIDGNTVSS